MNKKIFLILSLLIVMMSISVVCAQSMTSHNFGNDFTMDVPKDSNFVEQPLNDTDVDNFDLNEKAYLDEGNMMIIEYVDTSIISQNQISLFTHFIFDSVNVDLNQAYEYQEGDIKVMEPVNNDGAHFSIVCVNSGNQSVAVVGMDVDTLKDMIHTVEFN